jgi:cytochrome c553
MNEYRARKRANAVMQTIAARLSDEEIAALAAYFGSIPTQPTR